MVRIKQHDTKIRFSYTPEIDGQPIPMSDVSGANLSFMLRNDSVAIKKVGAIVADGDNNAEFQFDPEPEDVATKGKYRQEWELVTIDGKRLTFPNNGYNVVEILADLG